MDTQLDGMAIRRAIAHLSQTCRSHGHYSELYAALKAANPELAHKHWESLGKDAEAAGIALGLKVDEEDGACTTVLDEYLFGDSSATLMMVTKLSENLSKLPASMFPERQSKGSLTARRYKLRPIK